MLTDDQVKELAARVAAETAEALITAKLNTASLKEVVEKAVDAKFSPLASRLDTLGQDVPRLTSVLDRIDSTITRLSQRQDDLTIRLDSQENKFSDLRDKTISGLQALSISQQATDRRANTTYEAIYGDPTDPLQISLRQLMLDLRTSYETGSAELVKQLGGVIQRVDAHERFITNRRKIENLFVVGGEKIIKTVTNNTIIRWSLIGLGGLILGLGGFDVLTQLFHH